MRLRSSVLLIAMLLLAMPLAALPITFVAYLNAPSESPVTLSPGTGSAEVTIDPDAHTMRVIVSFQDLTAGNTAAHIGPGDANTVDTLGPVATVTPAFPGFPTGLTSGSHSDTFDMTLASSYRPGWVTGAGGTADLAESALFSGIAGGRAYFNIPTSTFPGDEIQGFLTEIPEPVTLAVLLIGMAALIGVTGRRARRG